MVQSPSWEANWFAVSQEIPRISRDPKVHYRTHKHPPRVSILGQPNPVHIPTSHLLEIHPNIIHPWLHTLSNFHTHNGDDTLPSPAKKDYSSLAKQKNDHILWNLKVHHRIHNSPPLACMPSQINSVHTFPFCFFKIPINIINHAHLGLPSGLLPAGFPIKFLYVFLFSAIRATCPAHLIFFASLHQQYALRTAIGWRVSVREWNFTELTAIAKITVF